MVAIGTGKPRVSLLIRFFLSKKATLFYRQDLPSYIVYEGGVVIGQRDSLLAYDWSDFVTFYLGCSFSFEEAMISHGIPVRNVERKKNVSMYKVSSPALSKLAR